MFIQEKISECISGFGCSLFLLFLFTGCTRNPATQQPVDNQPVILPPTDIPSPVPPRLLTICMGQEPSSLFLYGDSSTAARSIRQAIYDGPVDVLNYQLTLVMLEEIPNRASGSVSIDPITVTPGNSIVDSKGNLVKMGEGVSYLPAGCYDNTCSVIYAGQDPVSMVQTTVRFKLHNGLQWSDGKPLTADDSLFSFEIAKNLYPKARATLVTLTQSYTTLDQMTIEWRGYPGYHPTDYVETFFIPLPRHAWGNFHAEELLTSEMSSRTPIGWGPYVIQEWTAGDHITLARNPYYFRIHESLPHFDKLVFRFVPDGEEAVAALLAGECDYLDETTRLESQISHLLELQQEGRLKTVISTGIGWEQVVFGISSLNSTLPVLFGAKEMRQAVAFCLDRQKIAEGQFAGNTQVADSYVSANNPLFDPDIKRYIFNPEEGSKLLDSLGWLDDDGDPKTPRLSQGVEGVPDGTILELPFLTTTEEEKQKSAQVLQESLAQCGIKVDIQSFTPSELFAAGPEGPVFGRNFSMTQWGWNSTMNPPCYLYTSLEIPGPYPEYSRGWSGANAGGYSNPDFDLACQRAFNTLSDDPEHQAAHYRAQMIFSEDLPAIPLFYYIKVTAIRPDMCSVDVDPTTYVGLSNLELFNYAEGCK